MKLAACIKVLPEFKTSSIKIIVLLLKSISGSIEIASLSGFFLLTLRAVNSTSMSHIRENYVVVF